MNPSKTRQSRFWNRWAASGALGTAYGSEYVLAEPCDNEVFKHGTPVVLVHARSWNVKKWVKEIARTADARVDWHFSGGIANVLHLGNQASRARVVAAIISLKDRLVGCGYFQLVGDEDPGLYRAGVTEVPEEFTAAYTDVDGQQRFL